MERSPEQIKQMQTGSGQAYQVENFLSNSEINLLLGEFKTSSEKEFKKTGPVCAPYRPLKEVDRKIHSLLGPCKILKTSLYFLTSVPHGLHMDAPKDLSLTPFKAVLLPLQYQSSRRLDPFDISFFTFQQRWYGYPAKFFKGEEDIYSPHNLPVYEYSQVENLSVESNIPEEVKKKWLPHLKNQWLEGLTMDQQFDWKVGSAIVFDSFQIHCASDFRPFGVQFKVGLSIFTESL